MSTNNLPESKLKYAIFRILGNELPPRDKEGGRLETLRFMLDQEPRFADSGRFWIINRIHDPVYLERIKAMLDEHGETYHEIGFDLGRYAKLWTARSKLLYAININPARNYALELGRDLADVTFVLDGDCFMGEAQWKSTVEGIEADRRMAPGHQYFSIPMIRAGTEDVAAGRISQRVLEEPQLAFRDDAPLRFDESLVFGDRDKVELLIRLGHKEYLPHEAKEHDLEHTELCVSVGEVLHLNTGHAVAETSRIARGRHRTRSLKMLVQELDARAAAAGKLAPRLRRLASRPKMDSSDAAPPERFLLDFRSFRVGDDQEIVYPNSGGEPKLLPGAVVDMLLRCSRFRSAEEHAAMIWRLSDWPYRLKVYRAVQKACRQLSLPIHSTVWGFRRNLGAIIEQLARDGFFVPLSEIVARCKSAQSLDQTAVTTLGIVSQGDADRVRRSLESYVQEENGSREFVIVDLESDTSRASSCRRACREWAQRSSRIVRYIGPKEKLECVRRFERFGIPPESTRFALFGLEGFDGRRAVARNALLLDSAGEKLFCADDDVAGRVEAEPDTEERFAELFGSKGLRYWWRQGGREPVLAVHEKLLGCDLGRSVLNLDEMEPALLRRLVSGPSTIRMTFNRAKGFKAGSLISRDLAGIERDLRTKGGALQEYPAVQGAVLTDGLFCVGAFMGLDHRRLLPPFPPILENEDGLFGSLLQACSSSALCAQMPWTLLYSGAPPRSYPGRLLERSGVLTYDLLFACLQDYAEPLGLPEQEEALRLAEIGRYLEEIGELPWPAFESIMQRKLILLAGRYARYLDLVHERPWPWPHHYFQQDRKNDMLKDLRSDLLRQDYLVPLDLRRLGLEGARETTLRLFFELGRLLRHWPVMAHAAWEMRRKGERIAQLA